MRTTKFFSYVKQLDSEALRKVITKEIMDYHQPKALLFTYALRPVPNNELEQNVLSSSVSRPDVNEPTTDRDSNSLATATIDSEKPDIGHSLVVEVPNRSLENVEMKSATSKPCDDVKSNADVLMCSATVVDPGCVGKLEDADSRCNELSELGVAVQADSCGGGGGLEQNSVTDAKALMDLGIPCYGFAPLRLNADFPFLSLFHGHDERVPVSALAFGLPVLADVVARFALAPE